MISDLAMHLADLLENGLRAGARQIDVEISLSDGTLRLAVADDGSGFPDGNLARACDPFYTTKAGQSVGLGLPLLCQTAEEVEGKFTVRPRQPTGTLVEAELSWDHPDRPPLGDLAGTLIPLLATSEGVDFTVRLRHDRASWELDTRAIRAELGDVPLTHGEVLSLIEQSFREGIEHTGLKEDV